MIRSYAVGAIGVALMAVGWVGIQLAWRRVFPAAGCDPDALAGRGGCGGCTESCERRENGSVRRTEEET